MAQGGAPSDRRRYRAGCDRLCRPGGPARQKRPGVHRHRRRFMEPLPAAASWDRPRAGTHRRLRLRIGHGAPLSDRDGAAIGQNWKGRCIMKENPYDNDGLLKSTARCPALSRVCPPQASGRRCRSCCRNCAANGYWILDADMAGIAHTPPGTAPAKLSAWTFPRKCWKSRRRKTGTDRIHYLCCAMEDLLASDCSFDVVLSSLAFHYIEDFPPAWLRASTAGSPRAAALFSQLSIRCSPHTVPRNGTGMSRARFCTFPSTSIFMKVRRAANFLGETVTKYHRTLTTYVDTLLTCGFRLRHLV